MTGSSNKYNSKINIIIYKKIAVLEWYYIFFFRMYITFQDEPTGNVGFKGTTFHAIFGWTSSLHPFLIGYIINYISLTWSIYMYIWNGKI